MVGAFVGVASLAVLAAGPAAAATPVSQATAQSLQVDLAGQHLVSQITTAINDGTGQKTVDNSTVPTLATALQGNNALGVGVAPQLAGATIADNGDGLSYACAGIAGTGGGIVKVGNSSCKINGQPLTLNLGSLNLDVKDVLGPGAISGPLGDALKPITLPVGTTVDQIVKQVTSALEGTPLGDISLGGSLSAIEGICTANPTSATGTANIVDTSGGSANTPISLTLPGAGKVTLLDLPANPPVNYSVVPNPTALVDLLLGPNGTVDTELQNALNGALKPLGAALQKLLAPVLQQVLPQIVTALKPALDAINENLLSLTLNEQSKGDGGRSIAVTAFDLQVLPAAKKFTGASLVGAKIGHVTCGPNGRVSAPTPSPTPTPNPGPNPGPHHGPVPHHVDSGLASYNQPSNHDALIAAFAALLALAGVGGTAAYRRFWMPRG
ncbi:hypothetical protein [Nocardioides terrisoli]|uniref:hypothetical protein n=1 Tax=Nocardioides terrisoli TaxID=3388267 RepID=UPI00287B749F|nr:hypothetical protein [Nocardioides marmorisolisilvae]